MKRFKLGQLVKVPSMGNIIYEITNIGDFTFGLRPPFSGMEFKSMALFPHEISPLF